MVLLRQILPPSRRPSVHTSNPDETSSHGSWLIPLQLEFDLSQAVRHLLGLKRASTDRKRHGCGKE